MGTPKLGSCCGVSTRKAQRSSNFRPTLCKPEKNRCSQFRKSASCSARKPALSCASLAPNSASTLRGADDEMPAVTNLMALASLSEVPESRICPLQETLPELGTVDSQHKSVCRIPTKSDAGVVLLNLKRFSPENCTCPMSDTELITIETYCTQEDAYPCRRWCERRDRICFDGLVRTLSRDYDISEPALIHVDTSGQHTLLSDDTKLKIVMGVL